MTRRDTILMAVLINAGLLVILFATAITDQPRVESSSSPAIALTPEPEQSIAPRPRQRDLDEVVTRHSGSAHSAPVTGAPQHNFADGIAPVSSASAAPAPCVATPAPVPLAPLAPVADLLQITVKRGDTLDKIARANGTTVAALMETNGLTSSRLQIGDLLKLPKAGPVRSQGSRPVQEISTDDYYTIRSGDNPWAVAMKFHVPLDDLLQLNGLDEEAARKLKPGDKIRIR